jgi:hypothetical protein
MFQENEEVVDSAETTTTEDLGDNESHDESTGEGEATETNEGGEQSKPKETPEQRKARIKRMYEREFGKQDKGEGTKGSKEGSEESSKVDGDERYSRLELKTEGVTSKKAQDIVLDYAKYKGIEPLEALKSPIVRAEIAELEKKTSVPAPSSRTNNGASNDFAYWVAQAKKGNFPRHDKAMMEKIAKARIW